jgi:hypothetical protein
MSITIAALDETQPYMTFEEPLAGTVSFEDLIRQRAHEIWLARGCESGSDVSNWLEAEKEILQSK